MKSTDLSPVDTPDAQLIRRFLGLIAEGFENPEGIEAVCQLIIVNGTRQYPIVLRISRDGVHVSEGLHPQPQTRVVTELKTIAWLVQENHRLDYRAPELTRQFRVEGSAELLFMLVVALLRPIPELAQQYQAVTEQVRPAYRATAVERIAQPTAECIEAALSLSQPLIATGLDLPTPYQHWGLDRLAQRYGELPLIERGAQFRETLGQFVERVKQHDTATDRMLRGHHPAYTMGCVLPEAMRADFIPHFFGPEAYRQPQLWLGAVAPHVAATKLHRDPRPALLYQVIGRKKFTLYSPDQAAALYVMRAYNNHQRCWVRPEAPDYQRYPAFAQARPIEVCVHPGELLVLPVGWFHAVYCLDSPTMSVTYFLRNSHLPGDLAMQAAA